MAKLKQKIAIGAIIGILIIVLFGGIFFSVKQTAFDSKSEDLMLARKVPLPTESAYDPKKLIEDESPMVKLSSPTPNSTFSIKQKIKLFFVKQTFFDTTLGTYCCSSTDLRYIDNKYSGYCDYQCSGSFEYCDAICNPRTEKSCPSGYVLVNSDQNCCPQDKPYYKAGFCFAEPKVDYPTSTGCPNSICDLVPYPDIGGGSVLYHPVGFDPTMNCQNKFGNSPTGIWLVDPSSSCCFAERTDSEKGSSGIGSPANTLSIKCSDKSNAGVPCSQSGATATCNIKSECSANTFQCLDNIRYQICALTGGSPLQGVQISQYYKLSSISACNVGQLCENSQCVGDADKDGVSDAKDKCPNTPLGQKIDEFGCIPTCKENEVKLVDGTCKQVVQTCIDNNLNNICDLDDPIVWADPSNNVPICADRNADRICDGVEGLFCKDSNNNKICDSDEIKWLSTYCLDENSNGICDGIENEKTVCDKTISPVCDLSTNITYPNSCFSNAYNVIAPAEGSCKVSPIIIRRDCATGDVPIPSGYICDFETGWLFKREVIYQNITIDCRSSKKLEGYTCTQIGEEWVWTKTEFVNIDCYSRGCPKPNQLCQGGICVEIQKRCPMEIDCKATFGSESVCDEEIGLCTKGQYITTQNKTITITKKEKETPSYIWWIIGGLAFIVIILFLFLMFRKKKKK